MADFLGFWKRVKTNLNDAAKVREFDENEIYRYIQDCQNFESYGTDPAKTWERRQAYQKAIVKLKELAEDGIRKSEEGYFFDSWRRSYGDADEFREQPYVIELRKIAVGIIQKLRREYYPTEQIAAIMLATALDAAHKVVLNVSNFWLSLSEHPLTHYSSRRFLHSSLIQLSVKRSAVTKVLFLGYGRRCSIMRSRTPPRAIPLSKNMSSKHSDLLTS